MTLQEARRLVPKTRGWRNLWRRFKRIARADMRRAKRIHRALMGAFRAVLAYRKAKSTRARAVANTHLVPLWRLSARDQGLVFGIIEELTTWTKSQRAGAKA